MQEEFKEVGIEKKYVLLDREEVRIVVDQLKKKKGWTQKVISTHIGSSIRSVLTRGSALPYESYKKLWALAELINKSLNPKDITHIKKYTVRSMKELARMVGIKKTGVPGRFLSVEYGGMNTPHEWHCGKCGRKWTATPNGIMYQESWCRRCSNKETWTYEQMLSLAKKRGLEKTGVEGKFLISKKEYEIQPYPDRTKYKWECGKCGHIWEATANNVKRGSWCRKCQYKLLSYTFRTPYNEILRVARKVGRIKTGYEGEFLAPKETYIKAKDPSHHKFSWKCGKCENVFEMDITHVKRPQWCPLCTQGESETICREFFEKIFRGTFPKVYPEWLKNPRTGGQMHLDGHNELLRLAFEFNGPQHYRMYPKYHKSYSDFLYQQELDEIKAELCKKQGIRLILVPYWLDYDEFQDHIMNEYERLLNTKLENIPRFDWKAFKVQYKEFK